MHHKMFVTEVNYLQKKLNMHPGIVALFRAQKGKLDCFEAVVRNGIGSAIEAVGCYEKP